MVVAPEIADPWIQFSPTPLQPKTATVVPGWTHAMLMAALTPVVIPQPTRAAWGKCCASAQHIVQYQQGRLANTGNASIGECSLYSFHRLSFQVIDVKTISRMSGTTSSLSTARYSHASLCGGLAPPETQRSIAWAELVLRDQIVPT